MHRRMTLVLLAFVALVVFAPAASGRTPGGFIPEEVSLFDYIFTLGFEREPVEGGSIVNVQSTPGLLFNIVVCEAKLLLRQAQGGEVQLAWELLDLPLFGLERRDNQGGVVGLRKVRVKTPEYHASADTASGWLDEVARSFKENSCLVIQLRTSETAFLVVPPEVVGGIPSDLLVIVDIVRVEPLPPGRG